ncbi:hypothetical protein OESDEN_18173, partial [Oesophagostomum dentatum]
LTNTATCRCDEKKINVKEPLTLTISPKIWNLLETKAGLINDAVTSITFPEFSGKKSLLNYRIWDGKVHHFSGPKSEVSFQDMNNDVRVDFTDNLRKLNFLRTKVQKMVTVKVNSEVPKKVSDVLF